MIIDPHHDNDNDNDNNKVTIPFFSMHLGVPMVIVGITGGSAREHYARTDL